MVQSDSKNNDALRQKTNLIQVNGAKSFEVLRSVEEWPNMKKVEARKGMITKVNRENGLR